MAHLPCYHFHVVFVCIIMWSLLLLYPEDICSWIDMLKAILECFGIC
jgi:hypothetical protein